MVRPIIISFVDYLKLSNRELKLELSSLRFPNPRFWPALGQ